MSPTRANLVVYYLLVASAWAVVAQDAAADTSQAIPDTYPWSNANVHFGASIRTGRVVPLRANPTWGMSVADGGVYMMGSDNGGWCASVDGATSFDNANSGRLFSNRKCGGYDETWYNEQALPPAVAQGYGNCEVASEDLRPFAEGGPPTALAAFEGRHSTAQDTVSGPAPAQLATPACAALCKGPNGAAGCAQDVIYATNTHYSYFSPDAGRQWFPLRPQCQMHNAVTYKAVAADAGRAGHLVVLASDYQGHGIAEASGCNVDFAPSCAIRPIAWSDDVGPELEASILSTTFVNGKTLIDGKRRFERAGGGGAGEDSLKADAGSTAAGTGESNYDLAAWTGQPKWRFASIANLPAPAQIGGQCRVVAAGGAPPWEGTVVADAKTCTVDESQNCHGRLASDYKTANLNQTSAPGVQDRDAWCLDFKAGGCQCTPGDIVDPLKPNEPPKCRYPTPQYLEIDPRNGWAYLSTDVGLLASPDGGGHWIREGQGPASNPADKLNGYLGASLITSQFNPPPSGLPGAGDLPYDLNKSPAHIRSIGRMSLAFTPCRNSAKYVPPTGRGPDGRQRGHIVAALPVEWIAPNGYRVSSVFVASERVNCDPTVAVDEPGPLRFFDTANLKLQQLQQGEGTEKDLELIGHPVNLDMDADFEQKPREYFGKDRPKLLRQLPTQAVRYLRYTAVAVSPSDPRVMWAWSHSLTPRTASSTPTHVPSVPADHPETLENEAHGHGLWRSLDGGATWRFSAPIRAFPFVVGDPVRSGGGIHLLVRPELSVSPENPHKVMISSSFREQVGSGPDGAWIIDLATSVGSVDVWPSADCSACTGAKKALCETTSPTAQLAHLPGGGPDSCWPIGTNLGGSENNSYGCNRDVAHPAIGQAFFPHLTKNLACFGSHWDGPSPQWGQSVRVVCKNSANDNFYPSKVSLAVAPADEEAVFLATAWSEPPANNPVSDVVYDPIGACVNCDSSTPGGILNEDGTPKPCCVRWRPKAYHTAPVPKVCKCNSTGTHCWSESASLLRAPGASASPDYASTIVPAKAGKPPLLAVAGGDMVSSLASAGIPSLRNLGRNLKVRATC